MYIFVLKVGKLLSIKTYRFLFLSRDGKSLEDFSIASLTKNLVFAVVVNRS